MGTTASTGPTATIARGGRPDDPYETSLTPTEATHLRQLPEGDYALRDDRARVLHAALMRRLYRDTVRLFVATFLRVPVCVDDDWHPNERLDAHLLASLPWEGASSRPTSLCLVYMRRAWRHVLRHPSYQALLTRLLSRPDAEAGVVALLDRWGVALDGSGAAEEVRVWFSATDALCDLHASVVRGDYDVSVDGTTTAGVTRVRLRRPDATVDVAAEDWLAITTLDAPL